MMMYVLFYHHQKLLAFVYAVKHSCVVYCCGDGALFLNATHLHAHVLSLYHDYGSKRA